MNQPQMFTASPKKCHARVCCSDPPAQSMSAAKHKAVEEQLALKLANLGVRTVFLCYFSCFHPYLPMATLVLFLRIFLRNGQ